MFDFQVVRDSEPLAHCGKLVVCLIAPLPPPPRLLGSDAGRTRYVITFIADPYRVSSPRVFVGSVKLLRKKEANYYVGTGQGRGGVCGVWDHRMGRAVSLTGRRANRWSYRPRTDLKDALAPELGGPLRTDQGRCKVKFIGV